MKQEVRRCEMCFEEAEKENGCDGMQWGCRRVWNGIPAL